MLKKNYKEVKEQEAVLADGTKAEGIYIRWLIDENVGAKNFAMRRVEIKPDLKVPLHNHAEEHEIFILSGTGKFYNDKEKVEIVKEGDFVYIPSNEKHSIENIGEDNLIFLCLIPYLK
ncbi:MAG: cupin domain-containing protein [Candidatus Lokiarchaeota archaeon]|nr:cupin domain-containing protein [Candidatus Lokiarchaeota archaeon]